MKLTSGKASLQKCLARHGSYLRSLSSGKPSPSVQVSPRAPELYNFHAIVLWPPANGITYYTQLSSPLTWRAIIGKWNHQTSGSRKKCSNGFTSGPPKITSTSTKSLICSITGFRVVSYAACRAKASHNSVRRTATWYTSPCNSYYINISSRCRPTSSARTSASRTSTSCPTTCASTWTRKSEAVPVPQVVSWRGKSHLCCMCYY